jgi:hypothetical protein
MNADEAQNLADLADKTRAKFSGDNLCHPMTPAIVATLREYARMKDLLDRQAPDDVREVDWDTRQEITRQFQLVADYVQRTNHMPQMDPVIDRILSLMVQAKPGYVLVPEAVLNEHDLWLNPEALEEAATEIDCGSACESIWHESDTNASGCGKEESGAYCPFIIAELLRGLAKQSRAMIAAVREG